MIRDYREQQMVGLLYGVLSPMDFRGRPEMVSYIWGLETLFSKHIEKKE